MRRDRSLPPGGQPDDNSNARKAERLKTFEPIALSNANGEVRAHFINVSKTGGLIHAEHAPEIGQIVQANLLGEWHAGSVVWAAPPRFGLQFTIRLSDEKLARLTRQR